MDEDTLTAQHQICLSSHDVNIDRTDVKKNEIEDEKSSIALEYDQKLTLKHRFLALK